MTGPGLRHVSRDKQVNLLKAAGRILIKRKRSLLLPSTQLHLKYRYTTKTCLFNLRTNVWVEMKTMQILGKVKRGL